MHRSVTVCTIFLLHVFSLACTQQRQTRQNDLRLPSLDSDADVGAFKLHDCQVALVDAGAGRGRALKVIFAPGAKPAIEIRPGGTPWNWRGQDRLALDVANPTDEEIGFRVRLDDAEAARESAHSVGGGTTIAPRRSVGLYIPFGTNSSTEHGMRGAPAVAGIEPYAYLSMERLVDESHIVALRLSASSARSGGGLMLKNLRLLPSTS